MRYSAGAYAEEKVEGQLSRRLLTKEQLNLPLVCNKVDGKPLFFSVLTHSICSVHTCECFLS